ncbi:hypothetical protein [Salinicola rhizosphaerae]|uniref:DNA gyrase subunit B n=1 Tax=Salinicola rhizosphaerae TaxID=1443141 RepID=A0ABQ3E0W4_9GAMM|nr:hypothetical protein [Salinicola rhizosphaerae]GHB16102.1 hypothetical protein GCM10009038_13160 [Salinicola rhizosphaerae]
MSTRPNQRRLLLIVAAAVGVLWPLIAHVWLARFGAWPLLIVIAGIAWWRLPRRQRRWGWLLLPCVAALLATGSAELGVRLWPVVINAALLATFAYSLRYPPTLVERLARRQEPDLPPHAVRYTRRVTQTWCLFFALNGSVALFTALYADMEIWTWYNGVIAYLLMLTLFVGECCIRCRVKRRAEADHELS